MRNGLVKHPFSLSSTPCKISPYEVILVIILRLACELGCIIRTACYVATCRPKTAANDAKTKWINERKSIFRGNGSDRDRRKRRTIRHSFHADNRIKAVTGAYKKQIGRVASTQFTTG